MLLTLGLLGIITFVIWRLLAEEENPLDKLPGPPRHPIIGCALEFIRITPRQLFLKVRQYKKEYGHRYVIKIMKRRVLHVSNVKDVQVMLSHSRNIKKSKPYSFLEAWLGTGLLLSSGAKWHSRRKILTPTFHFNILKSFAVVMKDRSRGLVEKLKDFDGTEVDLLPIISDYTLFTICETAMGTQLDADKSSKTLEYKSAISEIGNLLLGRLTRVWLHNEYLFRKFPIGRRFENCLEKVHSFADDVIMERKKNWKPGQSDFTEDEISIGGKKRYAMLDLLLEAENKGEIDLEGIREEVNTFMFEGHDTTAMAIVMGLMLIADHEEVQDRIYEECKKILGDSDRTPTMSDLADMKYLEAVIKETLRLYPSVPFIAREITEDFVLEDLPVKKGSEVSIHIYDLHRRPDLFPEPDAFKPDRFFSGAPMHPYAFVPFSAGPRNCIEDLPVKKGSEVSIHIYDLHRRPDLFPEPDAFKPDRFFSGAPMHPYAFVPFSAGPRNCIGQRFAMLEMKCVFSAICRNFRLSPRVKGFRPALRADMLIRPEEPVYVKFSCR